MKITFGSKEVLYSGTFIANKSEPILFSIEENLNVKLSFDSDDSKKAYSKYYVNNPNILEIVNFNYDDIFGVGFSDILKIGTYNSRILFFQFRCNSFGENQRNVVIHYTFYLD